jgi:hypothetical protein
VRAGTLTREFPYFIEHHSGGVVYVDMSGPRLAGGTGSLIELEVRVKDTATGPIAIDFQSAALNEGHLTIGVPPQLGADPTDGVITVTGAGSAPNYDGQLKRSDSTREIPGAGVATDSSRAASFFESFNAKLAAMARRIGAFFDAESAVEPLPPLSRLSQPMPVAAARAQTIDLKGRLASFAVAGSDAVAAQLSDAQRWKRDLAGVTAGSSADPNSRLRIPASVVPAKSVIRES